MFDLLLNLQPHRSPAPCPTDVCVTDLTNETLWKSACVHVFGPGSSHVKQCSVLLCCSEAGEPPYITSAGFQFLLLDTASQLWYFTLQYLKTAQVCERSSTALG